MVIAPTAIVGPSGSGKSSSIENLPKDRTGILNIQKKVLPFKLTTPFKYNKFISDTIEFNKEFDELLKPNNSIEFIVIEDFSRYLIHLVELCKKVQTGWEIWNMVYAEILRFLNKLCVIENKFVFVLTIDEIVTIENPNGTRRNERRMITAGKQLEKLSIESFFTTVLFTERVQGLPPKNEMTYNFRTNADNTTSAKSPKGLFSQQLIPNDLLVVAKAMKQYWPEIPVVV